jgi:activator of HSP90 ATPase
VLELFAAGLSLAALSQTFSTLGDEEVAMRGDDLACLMDLLREQLAGARQAARFDARAE